MNDKTFNVTKYQYIDDGWEITDEKDVNDKLNLKTDIESFQEVFILIILILAKRNFFKHIDR